MQKHLARVKELCAEHHFTLVVVVHGITGPRGLMNIGVVHERDAKIPPQLALMMSMSDSLRAGQCLPSMKFFDPANPRIDLSGAT